MQLRAPALVLALLALLALCGAAQARPDGSASADAPSSSSTPAPHDASASHEADFDNSSSSEEDNVTVQGKAAALCPPRQPELLAMEAECSQDDHAECSTTPAPSTEAPGAAAEEATVAAAAATTASPEATGHAATTEMPEPEGAATSRPARKHRKRSCNYHLCVLKKLEVLDSSDMPDKTLLTNWIANNVTDEKQREKLQQRFTECVTSLKDIFGESSENSKSNEEETTDDKKNEETQPKKKSCVTAKKVISCLSKSVECPVLKF